MNDYRFEILSVGLGMILIFCFFISFFGFTIILLVVAVHLIKDFEFIKCFLFLLNKIDVIKVLVHLN